MSSLRSITLLTLTVMSAVAGCAGSDDVAFMPVAGSDGAYCKTYRAWKMYELDNGEGFDQPDAATLRTWWNAYLIKEETMHQHTPFEIRDEVEIKLRHIRTVMTPLMEKYAFDLKRVRRTGTAAEQAAFFHAPPAEVQEAQAAQYAYEEKSCGTAPTPPAADVAFEAGASSNAFCTALGAFNSEIERVAASGFDPDDMRALVTGDRVSEVLDGLDAAAPAEIAADVQADTEWFRTRWSDVMAEYGYDIRGIYLRSTPEGLAVFNRTHPDVLDHTSRTTAYEDQVCLG